MTESTYTAEHKVPTYRLLDLDNSDPTFYDILGPLLSRREVVEDLGSPVWDEDGKQWHAAIEDTSNHVLGMVGVNGNTVASFYVRPGSRGKSIGYALLHRAIDKAERTILKATVTDAALALFEMAGFKETGRRGRFHIMNREPS